MSVLPATVSQIGSLLHRAIEELIEIIASIRPAFICIMLTILFVTSFHPYNHHAMAISITLQMKPKFRKVR